MNSGVELSRDLPWLTSLHGVARIRQSALAAILRVATRADSFAENAWGASGGLVHELELELIQSHMAQKPVLRDEVGCACVAREVSVERGGMGKRGCARRLGGWVWV